MALIMTLIMARFIIEAIALIAVLVMTLIAASVMTLVAVRFVIPVLAN